MNSELEDLAAEAPSGPTIFNECREVCETLLRKNADYGNSALEPVRVFSDVDPLEQIRVRIDDKLSRIQEGRGEIDEDTLGDLIGYLILLRIKKDEEER